MSRTTIKLVETEFWTADKPLSRAALQADAPWVKWIGEFK